ncbi:MAG: class I SAM-dependent methyltransferase, partial [Alphaproteobacteria bacterium]
REILPEREIFVFERQVKAHPVSIPDSAHLILGDLMDTLPAAAVDFAGRVALLHSDIGSGDVDHDRQMTALLSQFVAPLLAPGALVVSDRALEISNTTATQLPASVQSQRYFMYQNNR